MAGNENCAWCLTASGQLGNQQEGDSHGICEDHSNQMLYNFYEERFNRVPSYVEQNAYAFAHEDIEVEA